MDSLNHQVLQLSDEVEIRPLPDGTRLMKQRRTGQYLAPDAAGYEMLLRFDGLKSVQEVFHEVLVAENRPAIRAFYDLVFEATDKGFLFAGEEEPDSPRTPGHDWAVRNSPLTALVLPLCLIVAGLSAVANSELSLIPTPAGWFFVLIWVCAGLSLGHVLAGTALAAFGRQIYRPCVRMDLCLPFFHLDKRDATMGGRMCELVVALNVLAAPFFLALLGWGLESTPLFLAGWVTALILSAPFGGTPAHDLLHAGFRKAHSVPRNADKFLENKMFTQFFNWREQLTEGNYFIAHMTYAVLWLGGVFKFGSRLLRQQAEDLLVQPGAPTMVFLLALVVAGPLVYLVWVLGRNLHRSLAPSFSTVERGLRPDAGSTKPADTEIVALLREIILFSELNDQELAELARALSYYPVAAGTLIIRERDQGDLFFIIAGGSVEVLKDDEAGEPVRVAKLGRGDVFGEIALLQKIPRTSSVRALTRCELLALRKTDFDRLLVENLGAQKIQQLVQVCAFLRRNPLFSGWPSRALIKIASQFSFQESPGDEELIREGHANEFFYLIYEGGLNIRQGGRRVATLGPGDFCGEISLLKGTPANAAVITDGPTRCLRLHKDDFLQLVSQDFVTALELDRTVERRLQTSGRAS